MGRSPCCEKEGLKKGPWTPEEDQKLLAYIEQHGHGSWRALPAKAGLQRCGKSCRLRWTNYLRPDIKRGKFSLQEEQTIIQLHALLGNRWSAIASHLPKRTDNEIKNFWNTHLKRRLSKMGIDPVTHKPRCDALSTAYGHASKTAANLSHMAQWESARLEAEARLVRDSKLHHSSASLTGGGAAAASSVNSVSSSATAPFPLPPLSSATSTPAELHNALSSASSSDPVPPPCLDAHGAWQAEYWTKPTRGGSGGGGQSTRAGQIDLESPTSPLSFSENFLPVGSAARFGEPSCSAGRLAGIHGGATGSGREGEEIEGEEAVDWKVFPPAPMQLFASKDRSDTFMMRSAFPPTSPSVFGPEHVSWLHEPFKAGLTTTVVGNFGDRFTEMLLNDSDVRHNSSEEGAGCSDFAGADDKGSSGDVEEESKGYWSSILNLVNSSSPSNSPAAF
ncbi:hypothetical protein Taro_046798 [Colocasia esculenta]|uniref:Uncharacterized protein n=1 Tax=Colocasia esculenta TaxID=4460 RepID=A0A843X4L4_COLES|nr:hypothetical protein [Colocasia esculenta]